MKLLAVVAIGVIALIGSPAFSNELTFQQEQCFCNSNANSAASSHINHV